MSLEMPIRILIAEHRVVYRAGLRSLLESEQGFDVVGEAENGTALLKAKRLWETQVLLLDIALPGPPCARDVTRILQNCAPVNIMIIAEDEEPQMIRNLLCLGARGCILSQSTDYQLNQAVRIVSGGHCYIDPELAARGVRAPSLPGSAAGVAEATPMRLSAPERDICQLIASGHTNAEIAVRLGIPEPEVVCQRASVMNKLGLESLADLVRFAIDNRLL